MNVLAPTRDMGLQTSADQCQSTFAKTVAETIDHLENILDGSACQVKEVPCREFCMCWQDVKQVVTNSLSLRVGYLPSKTDFRTLSVWLAAGVALSTYFI